MDKQILTMIYDKTGDSRTEMGSGIYAYTSTYICVRKITNFRPIISTSKHNLFLAGSCEHCGDSTVLFICGMQLFRTRDV